MSACYAVTGANGHLGRHLVRLLLDQGDTVIAVVRSQEAAASLPVHSRMDVRVSSLLDIDQLTRAFSGASGIFHVAAPTQMWARDPEREIVTPILEGTKNVLFAAVALGISKIVYTSTAATVGLHQNRPLDERAWNLTTRHPQFRAKREVEQTLTAVADSKGVAFISLCPPSVIGPGALKETPSLKPYRQLREGTLSFLPPMKFHLLDVRDHARAQVKVMQAENQHHRYIVAGHYVDLRDVIAEISSLFPDLSLPRYTLPKQFFYGLSAMDALGALWTKQRELSWAVARECIGCDQRLDGSRLEKEYEVPFRTVRETLYDTMSSS